MLNFHEPIADVKMPPDIGTHIADDTHKEIDRIKVFLSDGFSEARVCGPNALVSKVVTITPAQAEFILDGYNHDNRPLKPGTVDKYAAVMGRGDWILTSQGVSFSKDGYLNNGQHRLAAVVASGAHVRFTVTFGEDRGAFQYLDTGRNRTAADVLAIAGYTSCAALAGATRLAVIVDQGAGFRTQVAAFTAAQLLTKVETDKHLSEAARAFHTTNKNIKTSPSSLVFAMARINRMSKQTAEKREEFFAQLANGFNLGPKSPVLKLRECLRSRNIMPKQHRPSQTYINLTIAAAIIKAWNAYVAGRGVSFAWKAGEPFPIPA